MGTNFILKILGSTQKIFLAGMTPDVKVTICISVGSGLCILIVNLALLWVGLPCHHLCGILKPLLPGCQAWDGYSTSICRGLLLENKSRK